MIRVVEGLPGSGKSYYVVHYLCRLCEWLALYKEWFIKENNILIISNIDGLKIRHMDLTSIVFDEETETINFDKVKAFFTLDNFRRLKAEYKVSHIIVCIDEMYDLFPKKFESKDVHRFFALHRHEGIDIFLMTQDIADCWPVPVRLCEYIVRVKPRTMSVPFSFQYSFHNAKSGLFVGSESCVKKDNVFAAYKSFNADERTKPRSAVIRYVIILVVMFVGSFIGLKSTIASIATGPKSIQKKPVAQQAAKPVLPEAPLSSVPVVIPVSSSSPPPAAQAPLPLPPVPPPVDQSELFSQVEFGHVTTADGKSVILIGSRMVPLPSPYVKNVDLKNRVCSVQNGFLTICQNKKADSL